MANKKNRLNAFLAPVDKLGMLVMRHAYLLTEIYELAFLAFKTTWSNRDLAADRPYARPYAARSINAEIYLQIYYNGYRALPIILILGLLTGAAAIFQAVNQLNMLGSYEILGEFLVMVLAREVAPFLTALIVIARSATSVTTQLGNMRASGEIAALQSMGVHPYSFVVFPRLVGGIASVGGLSIFFLLSAFVAGYVVTSTYHEMDPRFYYDIIMQALGRPEGWFLFFTKVVANAVTIFSIACYFGLQVGRSHHEVPVAASRAVMRCLSYVITLNVGISVIFYSVVYAMRGFA